jgi:hypothetical protein
MSKKDFIAYDAIPEIADIISEDDDLIASEIGVCLADFEDYFQRHRDMYAVWDIHSLDMTDKKTITWVCMLDQLISLRYVAEVPDGAPAAKLKNALEPIFARYGLSDVLEESKLEDPVTDPAELMRGNVRPNSIKMFWALSSELEKKKLILGEIEYVSDRHNLFIANRNAESAFAALREKYDLSYVLCQSFGATKCIRDNLLFINPNSFYAKVTKLTKNKNRDLEDYLRALYSIVQREQTQSMTEELFFTILAEAYSEEPAPFCDAWLTRTESPDRNTLIRKFTNSEFRDLVSHPVVTDVSGIDFTIAVLEFQIAELHLMRDKQLKDDQRYFGIDSEAGNRWYNFDPNANLECGARGLEDTYEGGGEPQYTWGLIGELLETGRVYE